MTACDKETPNASGLSDTLLSGAAAKCVSQGVMLTIQTHLNKLKCLQSQLPKDVGVAPSQNMPEVVNLRQHHRQYNNRAQGTGLLYSKHIYVNSRLWSGLQ